MSVTSQVNPEEAKEMLEPFVKEGKDVLHLSFSSGLSGTANSMRMAAEELSEEYPERKILAVDTLCACMGEGLLLHKALQLKAAGKTMEEVAQWVEENKLHICHILTLSLFPGQKFPMAPVLLVERLSGNPLSLHICRQRPPRF